MFASCHWLQLSEVIQNCFRQKVPILTLFCQKLFFGQKASFCPDYVTIFPNALLQSIEMRSLTTCESLELFNQMFFTINDCFHYNQLHNRFRIIPNFHWNWQTGSAIKSTQESWVKIQVNCLVDDSLLPKINSVNV